MKLIYGLVLSVLALVAVDKTQRRGGPIESPPSFKTIGFECEDLDICWTQAGFYICAEKATFVNTELIEFGNNSIASSASCTSEEEPSFLLTFNPPMDTIAVLSLTLHPDSDLDRPQLYCWQPGELVGDESVAILFEPSQPMPLGDIYTVGTIGFATQYDGVTACRVYGIVDNFTIWSF